MWFIVCFYQVSAGNETHFVTLSQVKSRSLAMGGAFTAVNDNLAAILFNPATIEQYRLPKDFRMTFYLNPLASITSFYEMQKSGTYDQENILKMTAILVKAVMLSFNSVELGFNLSEESLANRYFLARKNFLAVNGHWVDYSHSVSLRLRLAPQVALGLTTTFYQVEQQMGKSWMVGNSYGVFMRPDKKFSVGVFYLALPRKIVDHRQALERLTNDTVNIGFAYQPISNVTLALDVRNINQEKEENATEAHFGAEYIWKSWVALRTGFYQPQPRSPVFSAGIGLFSMDKLSKTNNQFSIAPFLINYTLIYETNHSEPVWWHLFACILRL